MSTLYVCLTCNTDEEAINAVNTISANDYVGVKNCPDCNKEEKECPLCETGYEHNHEKEEAK
jgi:hypothetical protein